MALPEKQIPKNPPTYRLTTEFQEACEDKEIAKKVLNQKVEITLGDFLGSAHGAAKIFAAGLKLKHDYNPKHQEPLTKQDEYYDHIRTLMDRDLDEDLSPQTQENYQAQVNLVGSLGPNPLFAMDTGKIAAKATGQNGTKDVVLMIDTGSKLNLISQEVQKRLNIPIDYNGQNWSLQGINSGPEPLIGCC
ncbi:hypothetical protein BS47DRAFT_1366686 [Hydnum rufescens UP504]|uniref:DUF4100 domain-containing protein n=1 Tax=Hydnum rufescens UP504 TaxID=1448309 RepID=A0A9P6DQI4_9AGAM|nr:hypothetical protein BS47DRAFT_1366686 [Hydnum rufescens UP504]